MAYQAVVKARQEAEANMDNIIEAIRIGMEMRKETEAAKQLAAEKETERKG